MVKNQSHTLAYSLIALQEMNLAFKYPIIFWNCACLISDSGGNEKEEEEEETIIEIEEIYTNCIEDFDITENEDDDEEEECLTNVKTKKKPINTNYSKIATAIGKMKMSGIDIEPPDINKSAFTFSPDVENNVIRYGMSGIVKVGKELVYDIINNRPYTSIEDFENKVKVTKPQLINLIKCGAFDNLYKDRIEAMKHFIERAAEPKKRITMQNLKMLWDFDLIPDEYEFQHKVFNFNSYLKKLKEDNYIMLDNIAFNFYSKNFDIDYLMPAATESGFKIKKDTWKIIYDKQMDKVRPFVKNNSEELLTKVNNILISDLWNKYCSGNLSKWEMDSVSCYFHDHELKNINESKYGINNYELMPRDPVIDRYINIKGAKVPIFRITRIAGTVLDRDKNKKTVTLLTNNGVVTVKVYGTVFANFDKQISEKGPDGKKHVLEKSWFSRGNKIIVTGIKREDSFIAKKYTSTPHHLIELINKINDDGTLDLISERRE